MAGTVLLAIPWLMPATYGPINAMVQLLTSWMCLALWMGIRNRGDANHTSPVQSIALAWCLGAVCSAVFALLQYFGAAQYLSPLVNYAAPGEAYGNLRQRNQQATLLAIGLCALLWCRVRLLPSQGASRRKRNLRVLCGLGTVLLAAALAASGSRTGLLQLLSLLVLSLRWKHGRANLSAAVLVYVLAALALPYLAGLDPRHSGILGRVEEAAAGCSSRRVLWSNVVELIGQRPWTGWGWGELGYAHFMHLYSGPRFCEIMGNAHNLPLHLAVELGLPVALLVCGVLGWLAWRARPWRETDATRQLAWSVLAVIGLHSLLEYPLWYGPFQLAALLAVWMLWPASWGGATVAASAGAASGLMGIPRAPGGRPEQRRTWAAIALALAVLLACSYVAWDYWRISQIYLEESSRAPQYRVNTLEKIRPSWLFARQVRFAELGITPLDASDAAYLHDLALQMLHFSAESSVAAKVIDSALLLGKRQEAQYYQQRFLAAYPKDYAAWQRGRASASSDEAP